MVGTWTISTILLEAKMKTNILKHKVKCNQNTGR